MNNYQSGATSATSAASNQSTQAAQTQDPLLELLNITPPVQQQTATVPLPASGAPVSRQAEKDHALEVLLLVMLLIFLPGRAVWAWIFALLTSASLLASLVLLVRLQFLYSIGCLVLALVLAAITATIEPK